MDVVEDLMFRHKEIVKSIRVVSLVLFIVLAFVALPTKAQNWPPAFEVDSVKSTLDGVPQPFYYFSSRSVQAKPLVVSLHQWSSNYQHYQGSLAEQTRKKNWNYIHPDFRGPNRNIKACCSKYVMTDIAQAIEWAIDNMLVDTSAIYVIGASGGGYAALCSFMKLEHPVAAFVAFVPISNLEAWYRESLSRNKKYARDILNCTGSGHDSLDISKAQERSPIFWETPITKLNHSKLLIYTGIHDGYEGSVPITQSINFYNKLLKDLDANKEAYVPKDDIIYMLTKRSYPMKVNPKIEDRKIYYHRVYGNIELTIFDGGHEILEEAALNVLTGIYQNSL